MKPMGRVEYGKIFIYWIRIERLMFNMKRHSLLDRP